MSEREMVGLGKGVEEADRGKGGRGREEGRI